MSSKSNALEVWLDCDLCPAIKVGMLAHDRGQIRFRYNPKWLETPHAFALDPDLTLDDQPFFPNPTLGNFGVFLDSTPDRWGQTLMKRREVLQAKQENRAPRTLYAWDYLIGVQDLTRQGALRFRLAGTEDFLDNQTLAAPPVTTLKELETVALQLTDRRIDNLDALRQWLTVLVAPGASLGGARPKANFKENDGTLWIGKFPARDDERDIGAWEYVVHQLAIKAGIDVPAAKLLRLNNHHHTFCVQRFDRQANTRRFYASAMTLLKKEQSEGSSYLELAQFLRAQGNGAQTDKDLAQLFRRVVFNVAVGNRDDHLRNHGFLLSASGWQLAPAFDMNATNDKEDHVLNIDATDNRPNLNTVFQTAPYYGLTSDEAQEIIRQVMQATANWQEEAKGVGISRADIVGLAGAFVTGQAL